MSVLTGPPWRPSTVMTCDGDDVHVMDEDGEFAIFPRTAVAVFGNEERPEPGDEVLVQDDEDWVAAKVLDVRVKRARVSYSEGQHWVRLESVAIPFAQRSNDAAQADEDSDSSDDGELKSGPGIRLREIGWRYSGLILLGFAALGPALVFAMGVHWLPALAWAAMHVILAAYVHALNRPLPRFYPAGFGKPLNPSLSLLGKEYTVEHPPVRGKWELGVVMAAGLVLVGPCMLMSSQSPIPAICVASSGVGTALLAFFYDRRSASEARRLLGAKLIRDGADSGQGCLVGTAAGDRDEPSVWRSVLLYAWAVTRTVDGTSQSSSRACGLRRQDQPKALVLDTAFGPVEVPLRGVVWAAERDLKFGVSTLVKEGYPDFKRIMKANTKALAREQILAQDRVAVVGELRRDIKGVARLAGGEDGPIVMFAAGQRDPRAVLRWALLRRRAMIAVMVVLGLAAPAAAMLLP